MKPGVSSEAGKRASERRSLGAALRAVGRTALWAAVALLLVRGTATVLTGPRQAGEASGAQGVLADPAAGSLAVRFARAYLEGSSRELAPLLAPGAKAPAAAVAAGAGGQIEGAWVVGARELGPGQAIVTVACQLQGGRTLYVAVPIVREGAGEVAASGAPAVVAGPAGVRAAVAQPRPLAGPGAAEIATLARRFLAAYLSAESPGDFSYLVAPGASVTPPGGGLELLGVEGVGQSEEGEGPTRTVIASARVRDPASGATYRLAYRLEVVRQGRWYVQGIEGALS
ncbi:MAG TPA: conjugal transfer protein [Solirubrobacterales bacterium]|nr:conjugal transfer protein [Solirubrobacterales bacterium]